MVSDRCITVVKDELKKFGLHFNIVDLGQVEIMESLTTDQREQLRVALFDLGFELMDNILNNGFEEEEMLSEAEVRIRIKYLIESYKYAKRENSPKLSLYEDNLNKLNLILVNIKKNSD